MCCLQGNYVCWRTLTLTGRHISQLHIGLCIILYLLFAVKVVLKSNAYELCVLYYKYGVSWRSYKDQEKLIWQFWGNLHWWFFFLPHVPPATSKPNRCWMQRENAGGIQCSLLQWEDRGSLVSWGQEGAQQESIFLRKRLIAPLRECLHFFSSYFSCLIPLAEGRLKMIPFSLFQWTSLSRTEKSIPSGNRVYCNIHIQ